jgi:hypothetical protein
MHFKHKPEMIENAQKTRVATKKNEREKRKEAAGGWSEPMKREKSPEILFFSIKCTTPTAPHLPSR